MCSCDSASSVRICKFSAHLGEHDYESGQIRNRVEDKHGGKLGNNLKAECTLSIPGVPHINEYHALENGHSSRHSFNLIIPTPSLQHDD